MLWSLIASLLAGALIGWIASMIMDTDAQQGALGNVLVGIVGSLLGTLVFGTVLGFDTAFAAGTLSVPGLLWGLVGAIILIALLRWVGFYNRHTPMVHQ